MTSHQSSWFMRGWMGPSPCIELPAARAAPFVVPLLDVIDTAVQPRQPQPPRFLLSRMKAAASASSIRAIAPQLSRRSKAATTCARCNCANYAASPSLTLARFSPEILLSYEEPCVSLTLSVLRWRFRFEFISLHMEWIREFRSSCAGI